MRLGFSLPQHGSAANPDDLITVAKRAEEIGYQSLWVGDRLLAPVDPKSPYPIGDGKHPLAFRSFLDPLAVLTFVAGHTSRAALGTSVLILPIYHPVVLARQLMALDVLSKGRLRLGVGVGWNVDELDAVGVSPAGRGKRADEALDVMKAIWTTDPVEFSGKYTRVAKSWMNPKPVQKPHPPIYVAAFTPAALRRVALHADGWNPTGIPLAACPQMFGAIKNMAREAGRDPSRLEMIVRANLQFSAQPLPAGRPDFHGTLDQIRDDIAMARQSGVTELFLDVWSAHPDVDTVDQWLAAMERLWRIAQP